MWANYRARKDPHANAGASSEQEGGEHRFLPAIELFFLIRSSRDFFFFFFFPLSSQHLLNFSPFFYLLFPFTRIALSS